MKDYCESKESSYLKYWDANSLYGWVMSQNVSVGGFISVEETSQFNEEKAIIKSYINKLHKRL